MSDVFLGYDLGSSGAKAVLKDIDGRTCAAGFFPHETLSPEAGYAEQDPDKSWWTGFRTTVAGLLRESNLEPGMIKAVGITGFVPSLCALDSRGRAVRPAIMHTDLRAMTELRELNRTLPEPVSMGTLLPRLMWYKKHEPEDYSRTFGILNPHSYIAYRLTGVMSCDHDSATLAGGVARIEQSGDRTAVTWDRELLTDLGLDSSLFPEPVDTTSVIGKVTADVSASTGLAEGTPVIAGTGDSFAAMMGFGLTSTGEMMIYLGSSATQILLNDSIGALVKGPHFADSRAEFTGRILSCGDSLNHFRAMFSASDLAGMDRKAAEVPPGSDGLLWMPHFKQKQEDSSILNRESLVGMTERHGAAHAFRALLEGIAYNIKGNFLPVRDRIRTLVVGGGGASSRPLLRILADVLNFPVTRSGSRGSADGIALMAAIGTGALSCPEKPGSSWMNDHSRIKPDADNVATYERIYPLYSRGCEVLEEIYTSLDKLQNRREA